MQTDKPGESLKKAVNGASDIAMEHRVTKLETAFETMSRDVAEMRNDVKDVKATLISIQMTLKDMQGTLSEHSRALSILPSKNYVLTSMTGTGLAVVSVLLTGFAYIVANAVPIANLLFSIGNVPIK